MKQLNYSKLLETDWVKQFDRDQLDEIRTGLTAGVDVSIYAKPEFTWLQMSEIRKGLERGLDVSVYAKPEQDYFEMSRIRLSMLPDSDDSDWMEWV